MKLTNSISRVTSYMISKYDEWEKRKKDAEQQRYEQQKRLNALAPPAVFLNEEQLLNVHDYVATRPIPNIPAPPLQLTSEQGLAITEHMLWQITVNRDIRYIKHATMVLLPGGMSTMAGIWHDLHLELYQVIIAPNNKRAFNDCMVEPFMQTATLEDMTKYIFRYNVGKYHESYFIKIDDFCKKGPQSPGYRHLMQKYGLTGIEAVWNGVDDLLVIKVW